MKRTLPKKSLAILPILQQFQAELIAVYGKNLEGFILFGSYARGDFHAESDVDILLLFPDGTAIHKEAKKVMDIAYNFLYDDGYFLMPILTFKTLFETARSPLYMNIKREGVKIKQIKS